MKQWRVIGVDSTTGKGRSMVVEAANERGAQEQANDHGMLVERVEPCRVDNPKAAPSTPSAEREPQATAALYEPAHHPEREHSFKNAVVNYMKFDLSLPFFGEKRRKYEERGVNTVGEIAAGVFFGLLIFSCFSPLIIFFISAFWVAWLRALFVPTP